MTIDAETIPIMDRFDPAKKIALIKIYNEFGLNRIFDLSETVRERYIFGDILAYCLNNEDDQLLFLTSGALLAAEGPVAVGSFIFRNVELHGFDWAKKYYSILVQREYSHVTLARFLVCVPMSHELFNFLEEGEDEVAQEVWRLTNPNLYQLSREEKNRAIDYLVTANRTAVALRQIGLQPDAFETKTIFSCLSSITNEPTSNRQLRGFDVERIFTELYNRNPQNDLKKRLPLLPFRPFQIFLDKRHVQGVTVPELELQILHRLRPAKIIPTFVAVLPDQPDRLIIIKYPKAAPKHIVKSIQISPHVPTEILGQFAFDLVVKGRQIIDIPSI